MAEKETKVEGRNPEGDRSPSATVKRFIAELDQPESSDALEDFQFLRKKLAVYYDISDISLGDRLASVFMRVVPVPANSLDASRREAQAGVGQCDKLLLTLKRALGQLFPDFPENDDLDEESSFREGKEHTFRVIESFADNELSRRKGIYLKIASNRGKDRNDSVLVLLCLTILKDTGKPMYSRIERLVDVAYRAHGLLPESEETKRKSNAEDRPTAGPREGDRIRKILQRFKLNQPNQYRQLLQKVGLPIPPEMQPVRSEASKRAMKRLE